MRNKSKPKKSIRWKVSLILILFITLGITGTIGFQFIKNDYSIVKYLPVSQETKTRSFWRNLENYKLDKLVEDKKIKSFRFERFDVFFPVEYIDVILDSNDAYYYKFYFNRGDEAPHVIVYSLSDEFGVELGQPIVSFIPHGTTIKDVNNYGELNKNLEDQITKKGLKLYNQFVEDYNNL